MPYNDSRSDVFSNPTELKRFESLHPQVVQRLHTIKLAVENIASLESIYLDSSEITTQNINNPLLEQIEQNVDINSARTNLDNAYIEAA